MISIAIILTHLNTKDVCENKIDNDIGWCCLSLDSFDKNHGTLFEVNVRSATEIVNREQTDLI